MFRPRVEWNPYFSGIYFLSFVAGFAFYGLDSAWLWAYGIHFFIFTFGIGFGFHRLIIHRTIQTFTPIKRLALIVGTLANTGSAITWGTSHYLHHMAPDTEVDPHTPKFYGFRLLLGFYNTDEILKNYKKIFSALKHIAGDRFVVKAHNYYYLIVGSYYLLTFLVGGLKGLLFFGLIPTGLSYYGIIFVNFMNHGHIGYRNFETKDDSRNVWFLWFLVFGENWHNNHHYLPNARTTQVKWWEFDPIVIYSYAFDRDRYVKITVALKKLFLRFSSKDNDYVY